MGGRIARNQREVSEGAVLSNAVAIIFALHSARSTFTRLRTMYTERMDVAAARAADASSKRKKSRVGKADEKALSPHHPRLVHTRVRAQSSRLSHTHPDIFPTHLRDFPFPLPRCLPPPSTWNPHSRLACL